MAVAICNECGNRQWWRNERGSHLADLRCEQCGGELRGLTLGWRHTSRVPRREVELDEDDNMSMDDNELSATVEYLSDVIRLRLELERAEQVARKTEKTITAYLQRLVRETSDEEEVKKRLDAALQVKSESESAESE